MTRLSATDAMFAYADSPDTPMNIGSVQVLTMPTGYKGDFYQEFRNYVADRLEYLPKFRKKLVTDRIGLPSWEDVDEFDLDYHIRRTPLRSREESEIMRKLGRLHHIPFDFEKPLFMFYIIEGLPDGKIMLLQKFHHTLADGKTAIQIQDLFTDEGFQRASSGKGLDMPTSPARNRLRRNLGGLVEDTARTLKSTVGMARVVRKLLTPESRSMLASFNARPITRLNQPLTDKRLFAYRSFPLDELQAARKAAGLTFNDIGLSLLGGALRRYLDELDELPENSLVCAVPVALESKGDSGNAVLNMWVPIGTHLADGVERATHVKEQADAAKQFLQSLLDASSAGSGIQLPSLMTRGVALPMHSRRLAKIAPPIGNVAMSNVPLPREPVHIAGAKVESIHGIPMLLQGQGVGLTFTCYANKVVIGAISCEELMPDPDRLLDYMGEELRALRPRTKKRTRKQGTSHGQPETGSVQYYQ